MEFLLLFFVIVVLGALLRRQEDEPLFKEKPQPYKPSEQFGRNAVPEEPYKWQPDLEYDIQEDKSMGRHERSRVRLVRRPKD